MSALHSFFVIGHPLAHSMSPYIHRRLFAMEGIEASYGVRDIPPDRLQQELPDLLRGTAGVNVTIPHKQAVIPLLAGLRGRAELYRSVNTIAVTPEGAIGYNTDADGFLCALKAAGVGLKGRVALLGCGGVGRTFACEAALAGGTLVNAVREADLPAARALREDVTKLAGCAAYEIVGLQELEGEFDLLVNATPVGMFPHADVSPVAPGALARTAAVFDAVYNPGETLLLRQAAAAGAKAIGGMAMLVWQAAAAHTIWFGTQFDPAAVQSLVGDATAEMEKTFRA